MLAQLARWCAGVRALGNHGVDRRCVRRVHQTARKRSRVASLTLSFSGSGMICGDELEVFLARKNQETQHTQCKRTWIYNLCCCRLCTNALKHGAYIDNFRCGCMSIWYTRWARRAFATFAVVGRYPQLTAVASDGATIIAMAAHLLHRFYHWYC